MGASPICIQWFNFSYIVWIIHIQFHGLMNHLPILWVNHLHICMYIYTRIYTYIYIYIHWCLTRQPRQRPATEDSFFKDTSNLALKQAVWGVGGGVTSGEPNQKTFIWSYGLGDKLQMVRQSVFYVSWKSLYFWGYPQVFRKMCVNHHSYGGGVYINTLPKLDL